MRVVLDSNVFVSRQFDLHAPDFQVLERAVQLGIVSLIVPEIVVREVERKFREHLEDKVRDGNKSAAAIARMTSRPLPMDVNVDRERESFHKRLSGWLKEHQVEIPAIASVETETLVARALARRKPFRGASDEGMRDALIWEAVLDLARADDDEVVLVSQNTRDFSDSSGKVLHSDLVEDISSAKAQVSYTTDLRALRASVLDEAVREAQEDADLESAKAFASTIAYTDRFGQTIVAALESSLGRALPGEFSEPSVPHLDPPDSVAVEDAIGLGERKVEVSLMLTFNVHAEGFAHKGDAYHLSDEVGFAVGDWDWNEWSSTMSYVDVATVEVGLVVDAERHTVEGFQITRVSWEAAFDPDSM